MFKPDDRRRVLSLLVLVLGEGGRGRYLLLLLLLFLMFFFVLRIDVGGGEFAALHGRNISGDCIAK